MKYYAKVYTGNPETGLISPGEMLTDKQVKQLGEEKILELCGRGVLGQMPGKEAEAPAKEPEIAPETEEEPDAEPETEPEQGTEPETEPEQDAEPETEPEQGTEPETEGKQGTDPDSEEEPETEEELPELGDGEDLVSEAEPEPEKPAKKTTKSGKGRK